MIAIEKTIKKEEIFSTDIDGSRNVTISAYEHKVKRFIQISTTAVYGIDYENPTYENHELKGVGPYGIAKIEAEGANEAKTQFLAQSRHSFLA